MPIYPGNFMLLGATPKSIGGHFHESEPKLIVCHYTAGGGGAATADFLFKSPKVSVHFVIDRDGKVYQTADTNCICWHCGPSKWKGMNGCNSHAIGIEHANYGWYSDERLKKKEIPGKGIFTFKGKHKDGKTPYPLWEPYPAEQTASTRLLIDWIVETHPTIKWIVGHEDISPGRKQDPGPAWPHDKIPLPLEL